MQVVVENVGVREGGDEPLEIDQRPIGIGRLLAGAEQVVENRREIATLQVVLVQSPDGSERPRDISKSAVAQKLLRGRFGGRILANQFGKQVYRCRRGAPRGGGFYRWFLLTRVRHAGLPLSLLLQILRRFKNLPLTAGSSTHASAPRDVREQGS